jgi:hypothetical protein
MDRHFRYNDHDDVVVQAGRTYLPPMRLFSERGEIEVSMQTE